MRIGVLGAGYVGLTTALCFAKIGFKSYCYDIDRNRIKKLKKGIPVIFETGLPELLKMSLKRKKVVFTNSLSETLRNSDVIFIAVGTPQSRQGKADLGYYWSAVKSIIRELKKMKSNGEKIRGKIIVDKSTLPPGTARMALKLFEKEFGNDVSVGVNPEFLREGTAIKDFLKPDRIVIGSSDRKTGRRIASLYEKIKTPVVLCGLEEAELIKYASNAFLAAKISFINEMSLLSDSFHADIKKIAEGMSMDSRISREFLRPGVGYGGSCFPKDVQALIYLGKQKNLGLKIIPGTEKTNEKMKKVAVKMLRKELGSLKGRKVGLLGLAFKPGTDDMREASSLSIIKGLLKEGVRISAFDPQAMDNARRIIGRKIKFVKKPLDAVKQADAVVFCTEWPEFRKLSLKSMKKLMKGNVLIDGRNFFDKKQALKAGFNYKGIGVN